MANYLDLDVLKSFGKGLCGIGWDIKGFVYCMLADTFSRCCPPASQNWKRTPSFIAIGSRAAITRSASPVRSEKFVTAFELKRL